MMDANQTVREALRDKAFVRRAMREAVQKAVRMHKLLGHPIVVWRDGKVVEVPPEEIELSDERNGTSSNGAALP